jgi:Fe-S cluster assembly protein SufD
MTPVAEGQDTYLAELDRFAKGRGEAAPAWLKTLRAGARETFAAAGFPTTRQEEWRFTNVSPIANTPFKLAEGTPTNAAAIVSRVTVPGSIRLVLLNGRFVPELSDLTAVPVGLKIGSLAAAIAAGAPECALLGQQPTEGQPFAALNTAFLEDGALVSIRKGAAIETPIHVVIITGGTGRTMIHPRVLIAAGANSQADLAVSFLTAAGEAHFTNVVIEASLSEGALVSCCLDQRGTEGSFLVTSAHLKTEKDASFKLRTITVGGRLTRNDAVAVLDGEGAHVDLDGCYLVDGTSLVDNHTTIDHAKPNCTSHELYKGLLDGRAKAVFNGRIIVRLDAQKTDSKQTNRALLLSDEATINSNPQLEIFADDVKCTHGAAVGQLDEEAMFYLRARGLSAKAARDMLIHAYAGEVLERISIPHLRSQVERELFRQLDRDLAEHDKGR